MGTKTQIELPVLPNTEPASPPCWSCGDMRAAHFCRSCGSVQPPAPTDYFSFFGLPRKLNLDTSALQREMLTLSRRLHPDLNGQASEQEQEWSLEQMSMLNDAFRTLRDPILRTEYLLRVEGVKSSEESRQATERARTTGEKKPQVPPELLEEVFEVNMLLEEFHGGDSDHALRRELEEAKHNFEQKLEAIGEELKRAWNEWDTFAERREKREQTVLKEPRRVLDQMVNILNRRRYVDHLIREIANALEG